ncbi:enolase 4 [Salarias fasciatus]|uniref:enolase 4 n=1 Tax=Salarias fasciatus TaxID=181472 RepID=UPI001176FD91|nr:enolase 4 [Salarias fasciatus]
MSHRDLPNRLSADQLDLHRRRSAAAEFYRVHRVPELLETVLDQMFQLQPADLHGYLAEHFLQLSSPPRISRLRGTEVFDAAGRLSVQAHVSCIVCNNEKRMSSAAVSSCVAGQETSGDRRRVDHVRTAVQWINGPLSDLLRGQNPCDQSDVDRKLRAFFRAGLEEQEELRNLKRPDSGSPEQPDTLPPSPPSTLRTSKRSADRGKKINPSEKPVPPAEPAEPELCGSTAIGSVSLAVLKTGATVKSIPLYRHIAALKNSDPPARFQVPVCLVPLLRCGKTSPGKLSLLKEVLLIPTGGQRVREIITMTLELQKEVMRIMNTSTKAGAAQVVVREAGAPAASLERPEQPLDVIAEACSGLGLAPGTHFRLALNCAAPELMDYAKGKYEVCTGVLKTPEELVDLYQSLLSRYPAVASLIDPFRREDSDQWEKLNSTMGNSCSLIADMTYKLQAPPPPGARGFVLKHCNQTTVSDLIQITTEQPGSVLMGITCDEPCSDASWSDMVVGLGLDYVSLGGLSGAERICKYNRLMAIEEELAEQGILVSRQGLRPPLFPENPEEQLVSAEPSVCDGEQNAAGAV